MSGLVPYAHQRGVLHRDIKPSNILLDTAGEPHLTDFGLAKLVEKESALTHTNAVLGTPAYMAPESWNGEPCFASDQYSLAMSYVEMRIGRLPFAVSTWPSLMRDHLSQIPDLGTIPGSEKQVLLKALAKRPQDRYPNCTSFAQDLQEATIVEELCLSDETAIDAATTLV